MLNLTRLLYWTEESYGMIYNHLCYLWGMRLPKFKNLITIYRIDPPCIKQSQNNHNKPNVFLHCTEARRTSSPFRKPVVPLFSHPGTSGASQARPSLGLSSFRHRRPVDCQIQTPMGQRDGFAENPPFSGRNGLLLCLKDKGLISNHGIRTENFVLSTWKSMWNHPRMILKYESRYWKVVGNLPHFTHGGVKT